MGSIGGKAVIDKILIIIRQVKYFLSRLVVLLYPLYYVKISA